MDTLLRDLRFGFRTLVRKPGFTVMAVFTLALGIGANAAIFSVVNAVLIRPLPYKDPKSLVALESMNPQSGAGSFGGVSPADFWDFHERCDAVDLAIYGGNGINVTGDQPETIVSARVSVNFFETLGAVPMLGRAFVAEEGFLNGPNSVVISHRLWQRRFGGDPGAVGQTLKTDEGAITIIGVMPPSFRLPSYAEAWTALSRDSSEMKLRGTRYFSTIGRLKPGLSLGAAQSELHAIANQLETEYPKDNQGWTAKLTPFSEYLVRGGRMALFVLMGAVGFVLLIACANVANLLLVRGASRRREMAIRLALGASRGRLIKQLLVESATLAMAGGVCGVLMAAWGVDALVGLLPKFNWTFQALSNARDDVRIDGVVLLFALGLSTVTGLIFGLIPAYQALRTSISNWLKEGGPGGESPSHRRAPNVLVIAEIALALVLLVGAGLLIQSFVRLRRVDLGYDSRGLMTMSLALPRQNKDKVPFGREVLRKVAETPGVESASLMSFATFGGLNFPFNIEGHPLPAGDETAGYSSISPEYFRTLKAPIRTGREFTDFDTPETVPVAIINETLARQYFAGDDPIDKTIVVGYMGRHVARQIVGVAGDIKQDEPDKPTKPEIFVPFAQQPWFAAWLVVRTNGSDPLTLAGPLQQAIWSLQKNQPASKIEAVEQMLSEQIAAPRLYTLLLGVFAAVAVLLSAVGIYGLISYSVALRTREIGIRLALGATRSEVLKLVVSQGMTLVATGVLIGVAAAFALTRVMSSLLFGVTATDPFTFAVVSLVLTGVALAACFEPARRATKVDPMVALRYE